VHDPNILLVAGRAGERRVADVPECERFARPHRELHEVEQAQPHHRPSLTEQQRERVLIRAQQDFVV
jgi:hypothetical protein